MHRIGRKNQQIYAWFLNRHIIVYSINGRYLKNRKRHSPYQCKNYQLFITFTHYAMIKFQESPDGGGPLKIVGKNRDNFYP